MYDLVSVMEKESFVDPEVARVMNEHYVNIKVDRETHPDVDRIYMSVRDDDVGPDRVYLITRAVRSSDNGRWWMVR